MKLFKKREDILICILLSLLFLLLGFSIYLCDTFFEVPKIIRGYIPDFCWMFSFVTIFSRTTKELFEKFYLVLCVVICISVSIVFELMQKSGVVGGTFDYFDILVYTAAAISAVPILKIIDKRSKKQ